MPTQEMPDNELDDLFRKAAGEHKAEFEPEAWKRMEQLLDERDGRTGGYWWKGILVMLALLLVGTLGVVLVREPGDAPGSLSTGRQPPPTTAPAGEAVPADGSAALELEREVTAQSAPTGNETRPGQTENDVSMANREAPPGPRVENAPLRDRKAVAGSKEASGNTLQKDAGNAVEEATPDRLPTGVGPRKHTPGRATGFAHKRVPALVTDGPGRVRPETPATTSGKQQRRASAAKQPPPPRGWSGTKPPGATGGAGEESPAEAVASNGADQTAGTAAPRSKSGNTLQPAGGRLPELAFLTGKSLAANEPELGPPGVPPPAGREATPIQPATKRQRPGGRLSAGVMVSPDLSSIGLPGRLTPGTNVGLQLEYRLTNRLRVGIGAIHSVKLYAAEVKDYTVPYGFWTYGVQPSAIEANCKILDLPVHLRFDALRRSRYTAFVSTGLSSYVMLSERYGYYYPTYDPYLRPEWRGKRTGEHYLSVVNLSVGYERNLGRRFSWQAEPFLKLPLGGVGFGKVRLSSSGVFISLKYKIGKTD